MATFREQSLTQRLRKAGRALGKLQYPISEPSEPIFDLERYGASSRHSGSTRHSSSTFRRALDHQDQSLSRTGTFDPDAPENENVDIVVVEKISNDSQDGHETEGNGGDRVTTVAGSEQGSTRYGDGPAGSRNHLTFLLTDVWPHLRHFFLLSFQDPVKERHYQKESWFLSKRIAIWTSLYFYIAWILILALYPRPWSKFDDYAWPGIVGALVIPLLPAVLFDMPSRRPWIWRIFLFCTTWVWSLLIVLQLLTCHYYSAASSCHNKDFVGLFYYLTAMPTMSLFALRQSRVMHLVGTIATLIFIAVALIPLKQSWIRHFFNFLLFQLFILYISYAREKSDRKIFNLREQLKAQYKATQKAQVAESRASDSKKRFVNYIFHEVRVPLNTSLLALQNLVGEEVFKDIGEEQVELVDVLQSSLGMMEKVLNDVLDFNRMEAGKLLCTSNPFDFTRVIRSVIIGLEVAAHQKQITLRNELDPRIEQLGSLLGDEMRLRQILSNLASNACKFTNIGGKVSLVTRLILPGRQELVDNDDTTLQGNHTSRPRTSEGGPPGASKSPSAAALASQRVGHDKVTIRMEIHDDGMNGPFLTKSTLQC